MIDEDRTLQLYGYTSDELKPQSHKLVVAVCEECGKYKVIRKYQLRELCASCACTGHRHTKETRNKISENHHDVSGEKNPMFGTKGKLSPNFGKHHSEETKRKIAIANTGEKCYNWKGGITPVVTAIRKSRAYKNWRAAVFERDHFTCQMCGDAAGGNLQAHHIEPRRDHKNDLLVFDIDNGTTLCETCHREMHRGNDI